MWSARSLRPTRSTKPISRRVKEATEADEAMRPKPITAKATKTGEADVSNTANKADVVNEGATNEDVRAGAVD